MPATQLTNQTFVYYQWNGDRIYINLKTFNIIKSAMEEGKKYVCIDDCLFPLGHFGGIFPVYKTKINDKLKKGEYYCDKHKQWIPKGKTCGYCITP